MLKCPIEKISFLEYLFAISSLILYTDGLIGVIALDGLSEGEIDYSQVGDSPERFVIVKFLFPLTYIIAFLLLTRSMGRISSVLSILLRNIHVISLVGLAIVSTTWSELPLVTISRSTALVGTTIFGAYLAHRFSLHQQIRLLGYTFLTAILLSIVFAIVLPRYGVMGGLHDGAWRGIYTHKNEFGRMMALAGIVFLMQPKRSPQPLCDPAKLPVKVDTTGIVFVRQFDEPTQQSVEPPARSTADLDLEPQTQMRESNLFQKLLMLLGLGLSILMMVMSKSSGAIVNFALMTIFLMIFKIGRLRSHNKFIAGLGAFVVFCIIAIVVLPNPENIFAAIGKSSDLTGRDFLWIILLDMLSKNPLLGFGYGAFWEKFRPTVGLEAGWNAPDAHNGFLDLTLSVGLLGLVLFAIGYLYTLFKGLYQLQRSENEDNIYPLILLIYIFISNLSETGLFTANKIYWLIYVTVSFSVLSSSKLKPDYSSIIRSTGRSI